MIAEYSFLPWLRRGIAAQIQQAATAASRARLTVGVTVASDQASLAVPPKEVQLVGPGDVLGINPQQIVRTEPRNWTTDFEPNYLAFVEFYDEDFAWRYTPAIPDAQHRLIPWIFLAVLKETEFERDLRPGRPLPSIRLRPEADPADIFPPDSQLWAWAHVHLNASLGTGSAPNLETLDVLLRTEPDRGYCRLLSPRRLEPDTPYYAFVIPTFEVGRKAGLGQTVAANEPGLAIAWSAATELPVYQEWFFRTGAVGDFEELVRALVPRDVDPRVGIRDMDVQNPGFGMPAITSAPNDVVGLEGALRAPTTKPVPLAADSNFPAEIEQHVNLAADAVDTGVPGGADPVVSVPLYGRWHALVERISATSTDPGWVNELNRDPRHRAGAGMGTLVVQKHQEEYMRLAWEQIGEVLAANRKIRDAQTGMLTSQAIFTKYLVALPDVRVLPVVAPAMSRIMGSPVTLHYMVRESRVPSAALSGALRRQLRPRGPIARRSLGAGERAAPLARVVTDLNEERISAAPPRPAVNVPTLEDAAVGARRPLPARLRELARYASLVALVLLVLVLILAVAAGGVLGAVIAVAGIAAIAWLHRRLRELDADRSAVEALTTAGMTSAAAADAPPNAGFALLEPGAPPAETAVSATGPDSAAAAAFRRAAAEFNALLALRPAQEPVRAPLDLAHVRRAALAALDPPRAFASRLAPQIRIGVESALAYVAGRYADAAARATDRIAKILAYPDIRKPMYQPLRDISPDLFVPNLNLIPQNTISLMLTNQRFIESYMVGLNHEFGRELHWREYPTDQRGSPFRQFWDPSNYANRDNLPPAEFAESVRDIPRIHEWAGGDVLGAHNQRAARGEPAQLVLVIRGDLLKRYPNTIIYAQAAKWGTRPTDVNRLVLWDETGEVSEDDPADPNIRFPLYSAQVLPDIHFIGFDLTLEKVRGHKDLAETAQARATIPANQLGWFFVIQEVVGEPRFGLDENPPAAPAPGSLRWDSLSWDHLGEAAVIDFSIPFALPLTGPDGGVQWGANAADTAFILYQKPVMVAVHGRDMLKELKE